MGLTQQEIADVYRLSKMRVCQILRTTGAQRPERPKVPEGRFLTDEELDELFCKQDAKSAFRQQRYNATRRKIVWNLSFEEWWQIWKESGKFSLRGLGSGHFVMARFGDKDAYEVGNVTIAEFTDNIKRRI